MSHQNRQPDAGSKRPASAAATAGRLRLLQAEFADEAPELRQQLLAEELEKALAGIPSVERTGFLANLQGMFPTWDARVDVSVQADSDSSRSSIDERELRDPSFLVSRLIDASTKLSDDERRIIIERLREAGLTPDNQTDWPTPSLAILREQLKLNGNASINAGRMLELAAMLANLAASVDQVSRLAWKEIAPQSAARRGPGEIRKTMASFAQAGDEVGRNQLQQELEGLRSLIAALIQAVGHAGKQFARSFRKYTPGEIEAVARLEKRMMESHEAACWRKYKELAVDLNEDSIDIQVRQVIASYAESFLGHRH